MLLVSVLLLGTVILIFQWLYSARYEKYKLRRRALAIAAAVVIIPAVYGIAAQTGVFSKADEKTRPYTIQVNQTQSVDGTKIKLKSMFIDLMKVQGTYSICGKEKLVAIELKRHPDDMDSIQVMNGMWEGRRFIPVGGMFGMSYEADSFIDPLYAVFYLSNGKSIAFEMRDRLGVEKQVKIIDVNKSVAFKDSFINFTKIYEGVSYSLLLFESDFMPTGLEVTISDGDKSTTVKPGWAGGGDKYGGGAGFEPIKAQKLVVKVRDTSSKKEETFEVDTSKTPS